MNRVWALAVEGSVGELEWGRTAVRVCFAVKLRLHGMPVFPGCHRLPQNTAHNRKHGSHSVIRPFFAQKQSPRTECQKPPVLRCPPLQDGPKAVWNMLNRKALARRAGV